MRIRRTRLEAPALPSILVEQALLDDREALELVLQEARLERWREEDDRLARPVNGAKPRRALLDRILRAF